MSRPNRAGDGGRRRDENDPAGLPHLPPGRALDLPAGFSDPGAGWGLRAGNRCQGGAFPPGAGLALASDGAFPIGGFESKLRRIFERPDLEGSLSEWFDSSGLSNEDDATLALLRRSGLPEEIRQKCLDLLDRLAGCREQKIHPHLMLQALMEEIEAALQEGDADLIKRCARYIGRFSIRPGQEALSGLLDQIAEHPSFGKDPFERVLELARKNR